MTKKHTVLIKALLLFGFALATSVSALRAVAATPSVRVLATDPVALSGGSGGTFTLVRIGDTNSAITVSYSVSGTAVSGVDYTSLPGSATLAAGQRVLHVPVSPLPNTSFGSSDKTVNLTLVVGSGYNVVLPAEARVVITADRTPPAFVRIVAPRIGQVIPYGGNVTLDAEVADPDNTAQVQFFAGSTLLGTATTSPYSIVVANPLPGAYTLTAKVTDTLGQVDASGPVNITVSDIPPVVSLVSPANGTFINGVPSVTLQAVATDADEAITNVVFYDGSTAVGTVINDSTIVNNTYVLTLPNVSNGSHYFKARAKDILGITTDSALVQVTVSNAAPVISITSPTAGATFAHGAAIPIMASATDPDNDGVVRVDFYANGTLVGTSYKIGSATNDPNATYTVVNNPNPGNYQLTAKATDGFGRQTTSASVLVSVLPSPPLITLVSPVTGTLVTGSNIPPVITFSAVATDPDASEIVASVDFYIDGNIAGTVQNKITNIVNNTFNFTSGVVADGTHVVQARATDASGAKTFSATATVNVLNFSPNLVFLGPTDGQTIGSPPTVVFSAIAADADDPVAKVDFLSGGQVVASVPNGPNIVSNLYIYTWNNVPSKTYSIVARATDTNGRVTFSDTRTITVNNAAPVVAITSPANGASFNPATLPLLLSVTATATDSDDAITKVELYDNGTASKNLIGTAVQIGTPSPNFSFSVVMVPGPHKLVAKAYDPYGVATLSSAVQITVGNVAPTVTLTSPTNGTTVGVPPTVTLTAVASDTDDAIKEVDFLDGGSLVGAVLNSGSIVNNTYTLTLTNVPSGTHVYTAVASDAFGGSAVSSAATVTVNNNSPTITLVGVTNGTTFSYPVGTQVHVVAADSDDGIKSAKVTLDGTVVASSTAVGTAPPSVDLYPVLANLSIGTHTLVATASDPYGATTTTTTTINVSLVPVAVADQPANSSSSGSQASSSSSSTAGVPVISSLVSLPDGGYQLTITGPAGAKATVQSSSNFADWTTLTTVTVGSNGSVQYTDTNTAGGRRFYRLGQ